MASKSVGFISVPAWFDPAPDEFRELTRGEIGVQQTFLGTPDFDYRVGSIAAAEPLLVEAAQQLAAAGCSIIASPATPFGYIGHRDIAGARASLAVIERACGVECVSSIEAIMGMLEAWQVSKVALACTYYPDEWRDRWAAFVTNSGFRVLAAASLVDQGIKQPGSKGYPTATEISSSVAKMALDCPQAETIVVSGSGARTLAISAELRALSGKRIIAADTALFYQLCKRLEIDVNLEL